MRQVGVWAVACVVVLGWGLSEPEAKVPEDPVVGLQLSVGGASFLGDLTTESSAPVLDFQIETLFLRSGSLPIMGYLALDTLTLSTRHTGRRFPYKAGAELRVLAFLFIPNVCWIGGERVMVCGGLGQGTVNVNSEGNRRDYGTWNYQALAKFFPTDQLALTLMAKYVGRVEQQVGGVDSQFTFVTLSLGAGWIW